MNPVGAILAVAALAMIAVAGVVAGYRRRDVVPVEDAPDPLEDRRMALLRSLADLEEANRSSGLDEATYERLRIDTEGRLARVLRAIDVRLARDPVGDVRPATGRPAGARGRIPPSAVAALLVATVGAVLVAGLLRDAEPAPAAFAALPAAEDPRHPFAFFERRVREHPNDLAARLDLAHRYLDAERYEEALSQYAVALELDPADAEAHAHVGMILYLSARPRDALDEIDRALETAPGYPEALFFRGVVLLHGLDRPTAAVASLERYLEVAPFGAERARVQELIAEAERTLDGSERSAG